MSRLTLYKRKYRCVVDGLAESNEVCLVDWHRDRHKPEHNSPSSYEYLTWRLQWRHLNGSVPHEVIWTSDVSQQHLKLFTRLDERRRDCVCTASFDGVFDAVSYVLSLASSSAGVPELQDSSPDSSTETFVPPTLNSCFCRRYKIEGYTCHSSLNQIVDVLLNPFLFQQELMTTTITKAHKIEEIVFNLTTQQICINNTITSG